MRILLFVFFPCTLFAQFQYGFKYGAVTQAELLLKTYPKDTSAIALVLNEFANSYIQHVAPYHLEVEYHVKIKILKKEGLDLGSYEIPMRVDGSDREIVSDIQASTYNLENNAIKESKLESKNIFVEDRYERRKYKKFALPDVRVGSVIEIRYVLESPFIFNWYAWEFQSDIPKVISEFWAKIPGNYSYNVVLRGTQALSKNTSEIVKNCLTIGNGDADCAQAKYAMNDIPAFKEEEYMTAKSNFLSALHFELIEFTRFDGVKTKYTEEWKDADRRLQTEERFGDQIKQARKLWEDQVKVLTQNLTDPQAKARAIFDEIKKYYLWNEYYGSYTDVGAKKAYQSKKGNVADINLSLVGALRAAGLDADPAMLSTRQNGNPIMLHPVLSGLNYVIARVVIGNDKYWLDATHPLHPFGFVPEQCLNGSVRVIGENSGWVDLKPKDKDKKIVEMSLTVNKEGDLDGTIKISHFGYDAFDQRKEYFASSPDEYKKKHAKKWSDLEIVNYSNQAVDSLDKPFVEKFEVKFNENINSELLYFSPFLIDGWEKNPFRSDERNYPVDFGAPLEQIMTLRLDYQNLFTVDELPKSSMAALPQSGGRYLFSVSNINNAIQMTSNLTLNKSVYTPEEYHYLKELFARIVQIQQGQFVLKKIK